MLSITKTLCSDEFYPVQLIMKALPSFAQTKSHALADTPSASRLSKAEYKAMLHTELNSVGDFAKVTRAAPVC